VTTTFVDTGAWIGVAVTRDQKHTAAARFAAQLAAEKRRLLTANYVLTEACTRIRCDSGHAKSLQFDARITDMIRRRILRVDWITPHTHEEGLKIFRRYSDQELSIVDCTSVVVARAAGVREVFGFDEDFKTMGFLLKPSAE
jgi:hypothetical protein